MAERFTAGRKARIGAQALDLLLVLTDRGTPLSSGTRALRSQAGATTKLWSRGSRQVALGN